MPWLIWTMQSIFMKNAVKNKVWSHVVLFGHTLQCLTAFMVDILILWSGYSILLVVIV